MEPDLEDLLAGLKNDLVDLVADQQKQYDRYEAQMRGMNAAPKALFVKQQMDGATYDTAIADKKKITKTIKKISPNTKLLDRSKNAARKAKKTRKAAAKRTKGMPEESYVKAESHSRNSDVFKEKSANGDPSIKVETPLEEIYGPEYKTHVSGRTRTTPWPDTSTPTIPTDFMDGKMVAIYRQADNGNYNLVTMYINPK